MSETINNYPAPANESIMTRVLAGFELNDIVSEFRAGTLPPDITDVIRAFGARRASLDDVVNRATSHMPPEIQDGFNNDQNISTAVRTRLQEILNRIFSAPENNIS